jgi:hypothetical protein
MTCKTWSMLACAVFLVIAGACSKHASAPEVVIEIPSGFTGNFVLEMGVKEAPALEKRGNSYVVAVPRSGKVSTSTLLTNSLPVFQNSSDGGVWDYSHSVFTTGDNIPVGSTIEFFVGTKKDYEAEKSKKNHSSEFSAPPESTAGA